jgi:hypothetical protein
MLTKQTKMRLCQWHFLALRETGHALSLRNPVAAHVLLAIHRICRPLLNPSTKLKKRPASQLKQGKKNGGVHGDGGTEGTGEWEQVNGNLRAAFLFAIDWLLAQAQ